MALGDVASIAKRTRTIQIKFRCGHTRTTGSAFDKPCPDEEREIKKRSVELCPDCETQRQQRIIRDEAKAALDEGRVYDPSVRRAKFVAEAAQNVE